MALKTTRKMCTDMLRLMGDEGSVRADMAHDALEAHKSKAREDALRELAEIPEGTHHALGWWQLMIAGILDRERY